MVVRAMSRYRELSGYRLKIPDMDLPADILYIDQQVIPRIPCLSANRERRGQNRETEQAKQGMTDAKTGNRYRPNRETRSVARSCAAWRRPSPPGRARSTPYCEAASGLLKTLLVIPGRTKGASLESTTPVSP